MKIRISKAGIYGANGPIQVGTEMTVKEEPKAWAGRYEIVKADAPKDAKPVTNPAKTEDEPADETPKRRGRPPKNAE
jgi:hypothetical protein